MKLRRDVKIGIFTLLMIALMFWGINFLKGKNIFTHNRTYYTTVMNVDGLKVSGDVTLRGLKVGTITAIDYNPVESDMIKIEFTVASKYPIPTDSRLAITGVPIIGSKTLAIEYGEARVYFDDKATIPSENRPGLSDLAVNEFESVKAKATELVENVTVTLAGLNQLLSDQNIGHISHTLASLDHIVSTDLRSTVRNMNEVTAAINDNTDNIDRILNNFGDISDSLRRIDIVQLVANINSTVEELQIVVSKAHSGDGNLSRLLNDEELYNNFVTASDNLSSLLEDLQAHPRKYINLSIFGGRDRSDKNK